MTRDDIELMIGREIIDYEIKPKYDDNGKLLSYDIMVQPKQTLEHIDVSIRITSSKDLNQNKDG